MATVIEGLVSDKVTLATASTEYYLNVTNLPSPGKGGGYLIFIQNFTIGGSGIKLGVGKQGTDLAATSTAFWGAGTDDKVVLRILPGSEDLLMVGATNDDSFQYYVIPD